MASFFNGAKYSLVDASYAPFLLRYTFLDRIRPLGIIEKFPRLNTHGSRRRDFFGVHVATNRHVEVRARDSDRALTDRLDEYV